MYLVVELFNVSRKTKQKRKRGSTKSSWAEERRVETVSSSQGEGRTFLKRELRSARHSLRGIMSSPMSIPERPTVAGMIHWAKEKLGLKTTPFFYADNGLSDSTLKSPPTSFLDSSHNKYNASVYFRDEPLEDEPHPWKKYVCMFIFLHWRACLLAGTARVGR